MKQQQTDVEPGRKIELDTKTYCPYDVIHSGGDPLCDHDFSPEPDETNDYSATWKCTRCGFEISYAVWD